MMLPVEQAAVSKKDDKKRWYLLFFLFFFVVVVIVSASTTIVVEQLFPPHANGPPTVVVIDSSSLTTGNGDAELVKDAKGADAVITYTKQPSPAPTDEIVYTSKPTEAPTAAPTTIKPTFRPSTMVPTVAPSTLKPTDPPVKETRKPTPAPTKPPVVKTAKPTWAPTKPPVKTSEPTLVPTNPKYDETNSPTEAPTDQPSTAAPTSQPSLAPSTDKPTSAPSPRPTVRKTTPPTPAKEPAPIGPVATSVLWGKNGELWNPDAGVLPNFTNVGYKLGNEPIPTHWPRCGKVTDFGAKPNDDAHSDVQAFRLAMAACPPFHVLWVPNGRYIIDEPLAISKNNILIQGQSRDKTILFFPKHMSEVQKTDRSNTPFITFTGGSNRGIEDLSLVFRDEQKGTGCPKSCHWYFEGEVPIMFNGGETDSWMRNIYIKNANHGIRVTDRLTKQISLIDIVIDQFIDRYTLDDATVGHMGIKVGNAVQYILVHNVLITGRWAHDFDISGTQHSVFSRIRGYNIRLDHHAMGNKVNLYTEVDEGIGGRGWGGPMNADQETYWGIKSVKEEKYQPESSRCTMVGINTQEATNIGPDWHHETIDPHALVPANMYLAQMAKYPSKYVPAVRELTLPPPTSTRVFQSLPTDDTYVNSGSDKLVSGTGSIKVKQGYHDAYFKFNLGEYGSSSVASARLKLDMKIDFCYPCGLQVFAVLSDDWDELTLTGANVPPTGSMLAAQHFEQGGSQWVEFDLTAHVNAVLAAKNDFLSVKLSAGGEGHRRGARFYIRPKDGANPGRLVVHLDQTTVAPPAAPKQLKIMAEDRQGIQLAWQANTEADWASYAVYRQEGNTGSFTRHAMGLVTPEYTDYGSFVDGVSTYTYVVTAVDTAGTESVHSQAVTGQLLV